MKLLIITDAWQPQTNGVVTTLVALRTALKRMGNTVVVIEPSGFRTVGLPSYREIRVAVDAWRIGAQIEGAAPDAVHVATEGPLGWAARAHLRRSGRPFTTSLHTKFPEYLHARCGLPLSLGYAALRAFHRAAARTLVTTACHRDELTAKGFANLVVWGRGVDTARFRPLPRAPRRTPTLLYVGRIAVEKNLEAFLALATPGRKVVVGDGPARGALATRYPGVDWLGYRHGEALVAAYADADVLVFPSRTDTFGLVMLEAMACGTPVAAYPVTGPIDVVEEHVNGALDADLGRATLRALGVDRERCRAFAERHGWDAIAARFLDTQREAHAAALAWREAAVR